MHHLAAGWGCLFVKGCFFADEGAQSSFKLHQFVRPWRYVMYHQDAPPGIHPSYPGTYLQSNFEKGWFV